jgi:hypothetical protein
MEFEYIGNATAISKELMTASIALLVAGGLLTWFSRIRGKTMLYSLVGVVAMTIGGYYLYKATLLDRVDGDWQISIRADRIDWRSPSERVEASFAIDLADIDHVEVDTLSHRQDNLKQTRIVLTDGDRIQLGDLSGIDLEAFVTHLESLGVKVERRRK